MGLVVIAGAAGSGKDTVADHLVASRSFVKISLADPMKEFCAKIFGWRYDRLYGPSEMRNAPDPNWASDAHPEGLSARHALQQLGTEWGRSCNAMVWIRYAWKRVKEYAGEGRSCVISDCRFLNEIAFFRSNGALAIMLEGSARPLAGDAAAHVSEATDWRGHDFDAVIPHQPSVEVLLSVVDRELAYHYTRF